MASLHVGPVGCRAAPRPCRPGLVPLRMHPRQRGAGRRPTLPDGAWPQETMEQAPDTATLDNISSLNNAFAHRTTTASHATSGSINGSGSAPAGAASSGRRPSQQHLPLPPLVEQMLSRPSLERPEGTDPKQLLRVMEAFWTSMKDPSTHTKKAPTVVHRAPPGSRLGSAPEFDVAVCGGTLGIMLALTLQTRGHRVAVIERRKLQGRNQEWNIGRTELQHLVACGCLTQDEMERCIVSEFNPMRVGFKGGSDLRVNDVLNCGVCPRVLLDILRDKFLAAGGVLLEHTAFKAATVHDDGVELQLLPARLASPGMEPGDVNRPMAMQQEQEAGAEQGASSRSSNGASSNGASRNGASAPASQRQQQPAVGGRRQLTASLLVDCMGHYSSIVKQQRQGQAPEGIVLVVGGCWQGMPAERNRQGGDLLYTFADAEHDMQLFWEAFPAKDGRTAYMFAYSDAHPSRPSFAELLDTYFRQLPAYQGVALDQLQPKRILMGGFPCYSSGPLKPDFDRVLQIGDASAGHSPLSFGGFGTMVRHLPRLAEGVSDALHQGRLSRGDLGWLQPYQPSLSASWLLQRAMAPKPGQLKTAAAAPAAAAPAGHQQSAAQQQGESSSGGGSSGGWLPVDHVNRLLRCNFSVLRVLGDWALRPFLSDTLRLWPLTLTMWGMMLRDPIVVMRVVVQLGPTTLLSWAGHFGALVAYSLAHALLAPLRPLIPSWRFRRLLDALRYGSGADYRPHKPAAASTAAGAAEAAAPYPSQPAAAPAASAAAV